MHTPIPTNHPPRTTGDVIEPRMIESCVSRSIRRDVRGNISLFSFCCCGCGHFGPTVGRFEFGACFNLSSGLYCVLRKRRSTAIHTNCYLRTATATTATGCTASRYFLLRTTAVPWLYCYILVLRICSSFHPGVQTGIRANAAAAAALPAQVHAASDTPRPSTRPLFCHSPWNLEFGIQSILDSLTAVCRRGAGD